MTPSDTGETSSLGCNPPRGSSSLFILLENTRLDVHIISLVVGPLIVFTSVLVFSSFVLIVARHAHAHCMP